MTDVRKGASADAFTVTTTRRDAVLSIHKAGTLDAVHLDILTDGLPPSMPLKDAWSLLGQITAEGGTIALPGDVVITVTREPRL